MGPGEFDAISGAAGACPWRAGPPWARGVPGGCGRLSRWALGRGPGPLLRARARSCESETEREIGLFGLALARVAGLGLPPNERVVLLPALLCHLVFLFILTRKDVRGTCTYLIFLPSSNDVIYFIFKNNTHLSSPSIK